MNDIFFFLIETAINDFFIMLFSILFLSILLGFLIKKQK